MVIDPTISSFFAVRPRRRHHPAAVQKVRSTITGFNQATRFGTQQGAESPVRRELLQYPSANEVVVDKYPSGTNVTTLGPSDGIPYAEGVAVYPP